MMTVVNTLGVQSTKYGPAFGFAPAYLNVGRAVTGNHSFMVMFRYASANVGANQWIMDNGTSTSGGWQIIDLSSGKLRARIDAGATVIDTALTPTAGVWNDYALVFDKERDVAQWYIDGKANGSSASGISSDNVTPNASLYIGNDRNTPNLSEDVHGELIDIRIYDLRGISYLPFIAAYHAQDTAWDIYDQGELTLTLVEPTGGGGGVDVVLPATTITFTGNAPTIATGVSITVPETTITFQNFAPFVGSSVEVQLPETTITFTGFAPDVAGGGSAVLPATTITFQDFAPLVGTGINIQLPETTITFTGYEPSVGAPVVVNAPDTTIIFTGNAPTVATGAGIVLPDTTIVFQDFPPLVGTGHIVETPDTTITFTGYAPSIVIVSIVIPDSDVAIQRLSNYMRPVTGMLH